MFRTVLPILFALILAIGGGAASVWYVLRSQEGVGAVAVSNWVAFPNIGTADADPYSKARIAREGVLALGRAEGLTFMAQRDASGARLSRGCTYVIEGSTPLARFWTLYAADDRLAPLPTTRKRQPAIASISLLRAIDNSFSIAIGPQAAPGNWIAVDGDGPFTIVLTLYDTALATNAGLEGTELPQVLRTGCDA